MTKQKSHVELENDALDQAAEERMLEIRRAKIKLMEVYGLIDAEARVVLAYNGKRGGIKPAATAAGVSYMYAKRIVARPHVVKAIKEQLHLTDAEIMARIEGSILTRQDLQERWSDMVDDPETSESGRLKAAELLAKSDALLVDKTVHEGGAVPLTLKISKPSIKERIASLLGTDQDDDDFLQ